MAVRVFLALVVPRGTHPSEKHAAGPGIAGEKAEEFLGGRG